MLNEETTGTSNLKRTVEFNKEIKEGISTGEYKLEFKIYKDGEVVRTVSKTIVVVK